MKHISEFIKKNIDQLSNKNGQLEKEKKPKKIVLNENKKGPGIENMPFTINIY